MVIDAFSAEVEPGGLTSQNDIKILVCYLVKSVPNVLKDTNIAQILRDKGLANYFEIMDAISALTKKGHIIKDENDFFSLSETGMSIALSLDYSLPKSVRDKALESAFAMLKHAKIEKENPVDIISTDSGFDVTCHVKGGDFDMMKISLYAPDKEQAEMIKKNFQKDPEYVYSLMLSALVGDKEYVKSLFEEN
ncbi:MAG: DUF4364 family protein [Clostridia bacterium]